MVLILLGKGALLYPEKKRKDLLPDRGAAAKEPRKSCIDGLKRSKGDIIQYPLSMENPTSRYLMGKREGLNLHWKGGRIASIREGGDPVGSSGGATPRIFERDPDRARLVRILGLETRERKRNLTSSSLLGERLNGKSPSRGGR